MAKKKKNKPLIVRRPGVTIRYPQPPLVGGQGRPNVPLRALPSAPPGSILIASDDPVVDVIGLANTAGVQPIEGGGPRHRISERIMSTSVPVLEGYDPFRISISLIFDGWRNHVRVDQQIEGLIRLGKIKSDWTLPVIRLAGLVPLPFARRDWELDGPVQWDDSPVPVAVSDGFYRLPVTVTLIEHVKDTALRESIARSRRGSGARNKPRFHVVRKGENDFGDVSKHEFQTRSRAAEIARANTMPVGARLHKGQRLRLP